MSEDKDEINISYNFVDHSYKMSYVLARIQELEREHFALMVDRLDENHSEYHQWYEAVLDVISDLNRMKFIYEKLGGSFGSEIPGMSE